MKNSQKYLHLISNLYTTNYTLRFVTQLTGTSEPAIIFLNMFNSTADPSWQSSRIVSGWPAVPGQFPYQISLRMISPAGAVFACGGSIIHHQWVITAAHCLAKLVTTYVLIQHRWFFSSKTLS